MRKVGSTTDTADANGEYTNGNVANGYRRRLSMLKCLTHFSVNWLMWLKGPG
jgi:hypothetical protein